MAESVTELLSKLRFVGQPVEMIYLNETRVRESFIGQIGAIESFTRTATKQGGAETPVLKISGGMASEAGVTWTLADPVTQTLVLRAALESAGNLHGVAEAQPGRYVAFAGVGLASRPGMLDKAHRAGLRDLPGLYDSLEAERAKQESVMRLTDSPDSSLWLLTITEGYDTCATFLDNRWLRPVFSHWVTPGYAASTWEVVGLCRRIHDSGVPLIATLSVSVDIKMVTRPPQG